MRTLIAGLVLGFLIVGGATSACSSEETTTNGGGSSSKKTISAAAGGTVSDPSGTATLTIPPGALEKDTDISVTVAAAANGALSSVYDFKPEGTTFKTPAKLDIKIDGALAPAGKTLAVAIASGSTFTPLEGSTFAAGVASAPVAHFTGFAVVAIGGGAGTDGGTTNDSGTDTGVVGGDCQFKGTWNLEKYSCGATDITSGWKAAIPSDTLVITDKAGGGCSLLSTHMSSACTEVENFEATLVSASSYTFKHLGIASCSPASCKFADTDAPCVVGDRVKTETATLTLENGKLRIVQAASGGGVCGNEPNDTLWAP